MEVSLYVRVMVRMIVFDVNFQKYYNVTIFKRKRMHDISYCKFPLLAPYIICSILKGILSLYNDNTIYVIGDAKAPQNNPITKKYSQFFLALVIDATTDEIIDSECSSTIQLTNAFVRSLFIGRMVGDKGIEEAIRKRYQGSSQKALVVAYHDARYKYSQAKAALTTEA